MTTNSEPHDDADTLDEEQAVILQIASVAAGYSFDAVKELEKQLEAALPPDAELDGDEFGGDGAIVYMYGPSADEILASIRDYLAQSPMEIAVTVRYGEPDNDAAAEKHLTL